MENKRFTKEQITNYVRALKAGDAVYFKFGGEWQEVKEETYPRDVIPSLYLIDKFQDNTFLLVTLERATLRGGEKLVWLGENNGSFTNGKVYHVENIDKHNAYSECFIDDDENIAVYLIEHEDLFPYFGFIPRYKDANQRLREKRLAREKKNKLNLDINLTIEDLDTFLNINSFVGEILPYYTLLKQIDKKKSQKLLSDITAFTKACDSINKQRNEHTRQLLNKEWKK